MKMTNLQISIPTRWHQCKKYIKHGFASLLLLSGTLFAGCTTQEWYDGLRNMQREQCRNLPSLDEQRACTERNRVPNYQQYEKSRQER